MRDGEYNAPGVQVQAVSHEGADRLAGHHVDPLPTPVQRHARRAARRVSESGQEPHRVRPDEIPARSEGRPAGIRRSQRSGIAGRGQAAGQELQGLLSPRQSGPEGRIPEIQEPGPIRLVHVPAAQPEQRLRRREARLPAQDRQCADQAAPPVLRQAQDVGREAGGAGVVRGPHLRNPEARTFAADGERRGHRSGGEAPHRHLGRGVRGQPTPAPHRTETAPGAATLAEPKEARQQTATQGPAGGRQVASEGQAATRRPAPQGGGQTRSGERLDRAREPEHHRAGPNAHGTERAGRRVGQSDRETDLQSGRSWENSGRHQSRVHLAGLSPVRTPRETLAVRAGVHLQGLRGIPEPGRECCQEHPGRVNAFVDSRWLSGACLSREAPLFRARVVHWASSIFLVSPLGVRLPSSRSRVARSTSSRVPIMG